MKIAAAKEINCAEFDTIGIVAFKSKPEELIIPVVKEEKAEELRKLCADAKFDASAGKCIKFPFICESCGEARIVFISGAGKAECPNKIDHIRQAVYKIVSQSAESGRKNVLISVPGAESREAARAAAEGAVLAGYRFDKYLTKKEDDSFEAPDVTFINADEAGIKEGEIIAGAQNFARAIANEPANIVSPDRLAEYASAIAEEYNLACEILDEKQIFEAGMGAFYAVGSGSAKTPRFIQLEYAPKNAEKHIVLVGKGLTFDSGGLDIKPENFMLTMKGDKTGACAVLGAIRAAAQLKLPVKVTVLIAAAENMPSGSSFRPDDIVTARNGKTIEVVNTDAEGRLTLADALCKASELKPDMIVDIATLTGACAVALGNSMAGVFSNNDEAAEKILAAGKASGEEFWRLPMTDKNLRKSIKGSNADLLNCGSRYGGAITAAMFLEEFVADGLPWVHIDIAGADNIEHPWGYYCKGMTAFGTRTLINLLMGE